MLTHQSARPEADGDVNDSTTECGSRRGSEEVRCESDTTASGASPTERQAQPSTTGDMTMLSNQEANSVVSENANDSLVVCGSRPGLRKEEHQGDTTEEVASPTERLSQKANGALQC